MLDVSENLLGPSPGAVASLSDRKGWSGEGLVARASVVKPYTNSLITLQNLEKNPIKNLSYKTWKKIIKNRCFFVLPKKPKKRLVRFEALQMIGNCCKLTAIQVAGNPFVDETWVGRRVCHFSTRNRSKVGLRTAGGFQNTAKRVGLVQFALETHHICLGFKRVLW